MKSIIRHYAIDTFSLFLTSYIASGIIFERGIITLLIAGAAVTLASFIAKPVISLLLLPLNLVTFGLFKWLSSGVILFIVTLVVKDFKIIGFTFSQLSTAWIDIPSIHVDGWVAYVLFSFVYSFISSIIHWIAK